MDKKAKKLLKKINKKYDSLEAQAKLIEKLYPGPRGLTDEEVDLYADFDSQHAFQFFVSLRRKIWQMGRKKVLKNLSVDKMNCVSVEFDSGASFRPL